MTVFKSGAWAANEVKGVPFIRSSVKVSDLLPDVPGVYGIKWAEGDVYEYIGQSKCLRTRFMTHEHRFKNCVFQILAYTDLDNDMHQLEQRLEVEERWITALIKEGHPLENDCAHARRARSHT